MEILRCIVFGRCLFGLACLLGSFGDGVRVVAREPSEVRLKFLRENCLDCHSGSDAEADLNLETFSGDLDDASVFEQWVRIHDRVREGEMPPPDYNRLTADATSPFLDATATWLTSHQREQQLVQGRVRGRKLTNLQVERTLQDLLAIDVPLARELPEEPRTGSYTTLAAKQSISHFALQNHLKIVDLALDEAICRAREPQEYALKRMSAQQISRTRPRTREPEFIDDAAVVWSSRLIFYGRLPATTAIHAGWYRFRFEVESLKQPAEHGVWCTVRSGKCVSGAPLMSWIHSFEATAESKVVELVAWLPVGHMLEIRPSDATLKMAKFAGGQSANGEGGKQDVPGIRIHWLESQRIHLNGNDRAVQNAVFGDMEMVPSKSIRKRMLPRPSAKGWLADGTVLVQRFAEAAFRRPVSEADVQPFVNIFEAQLKKPAVAPETPDEESETASEEESFEPSAEAFVESLRAAYRAVLCSARFLYFSESPGELDDYAVASRLSYLLWNTMPDKLLLQAAATGRLRDAEELERQLERMLAHDRGQQFLIDFADQWLELRDIDFTEPDRKLHPDFDQIVQQSMLAETRSVLQKLLDENASVGNLVQADWTFANSRLARFYKLPDGPEIDALSDTLQAVSLEGSDQRRGLLTHGSILKVTANGTNTSPVLRGVWVSERILGQSIPPPPDSVPAIEPDIRGATTIREQLALHRDNAQCASCHVKIDPPGFALENFDAAGRWREHYPRLKGGRTVKGVKIDASYVTPSGEDFGNVKEFCDLVASDPAPLARCFAEHLLCYGTGAEITFADRPDVESIVTRSEQDGYGLKSILTAAVQSRIFLNK